MRTALALLWSVVACRAKLWASCLTGARRGGPTVGAAPASIARPAFALAAVLALVPAIGVAAPAAIDIEPSARVRVLIGVRIASPLPAGGEADADATQARRAAIASAQVDAAARVVQLGGAVTFRYALIPYLAAEVSAGVLEELRRSSLIRSVDLDRLRRPTLVRSAALIGAEQARRAGHTGAGVVVALADTGIDGRHPFLAGKVVAEACDSSRFEGNRAQSPTESICPDGSSASDAPGAGAACTLPLADCEHGTQVAGIIAGRGGPDGLAGVAPDAGLISLHIYSRLVEPASLPPPLEDRAPGTARHAPGRGIAAWDSDLLKALERVHALGAFHNIAAVNLSLAGDELFGDRAACDAAQPALADAVAILRSAGIAVVAAAGNDGKRERLPAPACSSGVIAVGASCAATDAGFCADGPDSVAAFSNVAEFLDLLAPGVEIVSSVQGGYGAASGTSMAAPLVAGSLALLRSRWPDAGVAQLQQRLTGAAPRIDDTRPGGIARDLPLLDLRSPVFGADGSASVTATSGTTAGGGMQRSPAAGDASMRAPSTAAGPAQPATALAAASRAQAMTTTIPASLPPPSAVKAVVAGDVHACALTTSGKVFCWGRNSSFGLLGIDADDYLSAEPVEVAGLGGGVTAIAAGVSHTCAVVANGAVRCWGRNHQGQLGDGTTTNRFAPVEVPGLSGVVALAAGSVHTCARMASGGVKCWGGNAAGQLGDGTTTQRLAPVDVVGLPSPVASIAGNVAHMCALVGGGLKCWGSNSFGQLGDGTTTSKSTPVDVLGLASGVAAMGAGWTSTCAVTSSGAAMCWGRNDQGQLGDGTTINRSTPVDVVGLASGTVAVGGGEQHNCALTASGGVKCWGRNLEGQLGDGTRTQRLTPADVHGLASGMLELAIGGDHGCARTAGGGVKCWGRNRFGQLGDGFPTVFSTLKPVVGLEVGVAAIATGWLHSCALTVGGGVKCWGDNTYGQVGDGSTTDRLEPVDVAGLGSGVAAIALGDFHSCALTGAGAVLCWGQNDQGQVGDGSTTNRSTPVAVVGLGSDAAAVAAGTAHSCAATTGGGARCWGRNFRSQLGDNGLTNRSTPVDVAVLTNVAEIAPGGEFSCARSSGGGVKCWGANDSGQVGKGTITGVEGTPGDVVGLASGVQRLQAGDGYSCVLTTGGSVKCWGFNGRGALGDNSTTTRTSPVDAVGLASGVASIATGFYHACAVTAGGALKCWGDNAQGQLGIAVESDQLVAIDVPGLSSGVAAAAPGTSHTCVLNTAGGVGCFGDNSNGQLGNGIPADRTTPVDVVGFGSDSVPDPFAFASQSGVVPGSLRTSNAITPVGYDVDTDIQVADGEYSIGCGGTFTMAAGSISPGQSVCVRHVASMSPGTMVTTTLTIGGVAGTFGSTTAAGPLPPPLSFSPNPLDFDGQSMFTRSLKRQVTISNISGSPLTLNSLTPSGPFAVASHTCGVLPAPLAAGGSCTAELTFTPPDEGPFNGSLDAATSAGAASGPLAGVGERSLVVHYYGSILGRYPEPSGKAYWNSEAARVQALGADLNEVWYALAIGFFSSVEYLGFNRTDGAFIDDLYRTFLNREPETAGRDFWLGLIAQGLTREVVLVWFMFSPEFRTFTSSIFGDTSVRRELDAVMDFYRGLLFRLPDGGGFNFWVGRFRVAQCAGPAAVTVEAEAISGEFARGAEYANRNRSDSEYVGDLYNAILRRGGDGPGVQFWISSIANGTLTREQVRQQFVSSPEFQGRVAQIIAAGCLP
jgi:alpha-tubulin suppressor-like RCC1 family protein/subtilisin family serine protease